MGKSEGELYRLFVLGPVRNHFLWRSVYTVPALPHRSEAELSFTVRAPTANLAGAEDCTVVFRPAGDARGCSRAEAHDRGFVYQRVLASC